MSVMENRQPRDSAVVHREFKRDAVAMVLDEGRRIVDVAERSGSVRARWATGFVRNALIGVNAPG